MPKMVKNTHDSATMMYASERHGLTAFMCPPAISATPAARLMPNDVQKAMRSSSP